ncbi:MAG: Zn-ribbon domain-containing OB-fold protein [Candidatus Alcyoniella australis]|nr:Zn-ribbon domain-containing OB-fold protein [Candidatus Alcyoniella australis]
MDDKYKDAFVVDGKLALPYQYFAGEIGSKFLIALRDEQKILGQRCERCDKVFIPPRKTCERCMSDLSEAWVEIGSQGEVTDFTVINYAEPYQPLEPPYVLALIKLDGADTPLTHLLCEVDPEQVVRGMRVEAQFADQREGSILDIKYFKPL